MVVHDGTALAFSAMLILQGADDAVVPPNQAETMAEAVAAKGLEVELIVFEARAGSGRAT